MPSLHRITIFPTKSLDGHQATTVKVLPSGALAGDRRFALQDRLGRFVNGKQCEAIHRLRARFSDDLQHVALSCNGSEETFSLDPDNQLLAQWCSEMLGLQCQLIENAEYGFPDDCQSPGPTLISTASLAEVTRWFAGIDLEEARRRFRMNLEIDSPIPFWEDRLVTERLKIRRFRIGETVWQGRGICQRCVVPTRDALEGTANPGFAREFSRRRQEILPEWSPQERFDHFYRLGVNTALDSLERGNTIQLGDAVGGDAMGGDATAR